MALSFQLMASSQNRETNFLIDTLAQAANILKRLVSDAHTLNLSELVYRIIKDTNYDLIALSLPDGKQRYKNIWKFYILAKEEMTATEFLSRLAMARELSVSETNATIDNKQSVKLMTIHAAKGLEFPAVALPCLSNRPNYNKFPLLFHSTIWHCFKHGSYHDQEKEEGLPLPYQLGKIIDDDMDLAERKRLLYVAMTRAQDNLALFVGQNEVSNKSVLLVGCNRC